MDTKVERILEVKVSRDKNWIQIEYERKDELGRWMRDRPRRQEAATPEFYKAYNDLTEDVISLCELRDEDVNLIEIKSVKFNYAGDNEVLQAEIKGIKNYANSKGGLSFTTPKKSKEFFSESHNDEENLFSKETSKRLDLLCFEAFGYLEGKRAQVSLFDNDMKDENGASVPASEDEEMSESYAGNGEVHVAATEENEE